MADKDASLLAKPASFKPNITSAHEVVIDRPMSTVFPMLAHGDTMEKSVRLSDLCTDFQLLKRDNVRLPGSDTLSKSHTRTLPASEDGSGLPRQYFRLEETVPLIFGLTRKVEITGTLTWDDDAKVSLYETSADQGILIWKLREFEEFEEGGMTKTKVRETIEGRCPTWLRLIVQKETSRSHRAHMDAYRTLF
ncbi:hypothetical protein PLICRDRAFT_116899 [Plicaturopsis crispa FD-325 SS-3]|uniref:Uncharacterized protein n=1 Tax=Plicaturopsis crispa FD-325 SS-3 TaxID=944288 RepID=A0A0C9SYN2_PLICR|nr:hypothetical protein PLICRDRAFT_116899 [Plicaturopsis crispa FD-325 SS-3]